MTGPSRCRRGGVFLNGATDLDFFTISDATPGDLHFHRNLVGVVDIWVNISFAVCGRIARSHGSHTIQIPFFIPVTAT